jgi:hypothetical protein
VLVVDRRPEGPPLASGKEAIAVWRLVFRVPVLCD